MSRDLYCPHCGSYIGDCGHVQGGWTSPVTLSGTCWKCDRSYSVTCNGDCLKEKIIDKRDLFISEDGKSIVDDKGNEIARFVPGIIIVPKKKNKRKICYHLECHKECQAWDSHGKCVRYVTTCDFVQDPCPDDDKKKK